MLYWHDKCQPEFQIAACWGKTNVLDGISYCAYGSD
jgi:hypothetical protein